MSLRSNARQMQLWWVRPVDRELRIDEAKGHLFIGDDVAMERHINELHQQTGITHAAQIVDP